LDFFGPPRTQENPNREFFAQKYKFFIEDKPLKINDIKPKTPTPKKKFLFGDHFSCATVNIE